MRKSAFAVVAERVAEVHALLLLGHPRAEILRHASKWKVSSRQVDTYIAKATAQLKELHRANLEEVSGVIVANLWDQYRTAKTHGNGQLCVTVLRELAKLKGLYFHDANSEADHPEPGATNAPTDELLRLVKG